MSKTSINVRKSDIIWNYIGTIVSMSSNFILLPLLLIFLTSEQIGLWYVFVAISGFAQLLEFGFTSTLSRNILYCLSGAQSLAKTGLAEDTSTGQGGVNWHLFRTVLFTSKLIYGVIGIIALVLASIFGSMYVSAVTGNFSIEWSLAAWIVFDVSIFTNLYYLYKLTFLRGVGDVASENKAVTVARVGQLVITAILLFCGLQLLAAAFGFLFYSIVLRMIAGHAFNSNPIVAEGLSQDNSIISRNEIKEVLNSVAFVASRDGIVSVAWYGATQATSLICSAYLGLAENATYSVMLQFGTALYNIGSAYIRSCFPMFQSAFVGHDEKTQREVVERGVSSYVWTYFAGAIVVVVCLPILTLFKNDFICDRMIFIGIAIYLFLLNQHSLFCNIIVNMNEIPYFRSYILSTAVGVLLTCLLCGPLGLGSWGLILGQAMPQLVYNNWKWPSYVLDRLSISYSEMMRTGTVWWFNKFKSRVLHR